MEKTGDRSITSDATARGDADGGPTDRRLIDAFLALRRLALVGVSRNPRGFSQLLLRELRRRGYEVVPANPGAEEIQGSKCFARVSDIRPPVEGVLIMTRPAVTEEVARDCAEAGVKHLWIHRGVGQGSMSEAAVRFSRERGMSVVPGYCPFMFLPNTSFAHRVHAFFKRLTGSYPK